MPHNPIIALCGNPNSGKTTLFNLLTGAKQDVGNWPGVTVEKKSGFVKFTKGILKDNKNSHGLDDLTGIEVVDLPGTYSLDAIDESIALDEKIARNYIMSGEADLIINIIDGSNIERNLYLTTQLLEIGKPLVIVINKMDVVKSNQLLINLEKLSELTGCPIFPIVASQSKSRVELIQFILEQLNGEASSKKYLKRTALKFDADLDTEYQSILNILSATNAKKLKSPALSQKPASQNGDQSSNDWLAIKLLEDHLYPIDDSIKLKINEIQKRVAEKYGDEIDIQIADARYKNILLWIEQSIKKKGSVSRTLSSKIDQIVLNKYLGIPFFLLVTYLMFMFTIVFGGALIDVFDLTTQALLVDGGSVWLSSINIPEWGITILAKGVGGGIQVVSTFIPIIGSLYLFLSVLEDSGYLARGAFVMDRFMQTIGLPGKSFIPLMVGLGCTVPAIYATRSLEYEKDRIMTVMMSPFISCGARLPVYILFAAIFFPDNAQNLIFALYLIGIAIAILTGFLLKKTILAGENTPFVMELPPYHIPRLRNVLTKTWEKLMSFVLGAGKMIVVVVVILSFLNSLGTDFSFGNENKEKSVLTNIGKSITPAFKPLGIKEENWPATVGLFTGLFAKEVVVATINSLYMSQVDVVDTKPVFDLQKELAAAVQTVPDNFSKIANAWIDPLGINVDVSDRQAIADEQKINIGLFDVIKNSFDGTLGAFSYLLFILLYAPCVSAVGAIFKETGARWTIFSVLWTTFLAYSISTIVYQFGQFSNAPYSASAWIISFLALHIINIFYLKYRGKKLNSSVDRGAVVTC